MTPIYTIERYESEINGTMFIVTLDRNGETFDLCGFETFNQARKAAVNDATESAFDDYIITSDECELS